MALSEKMRNFASRNPLYNNKVRASRHINITKMITLMSNIPYAFWLVPVASVVALGMALCFFRSMMKADEGTPRMKEIAGHVRKGAMAYLWQQYKVVGIVFVVLAVIFAIMAYGFQM